MKSNLQLKNLRHKFSWLLCLVVSLCSANAWAWSVPGEFNNWSTSAYFDGSSNYSISLTAGQTYQFKIENNGTWYGNDGTMVRSSCSGWKFNTSNNCKIKADVTGTYVFHRDNDTPTITVTYPTPVQTSYYLKHPWGGGGWEWSEKALTDNGDGTYSMDGAYGSAGCNWNTKAEDNGSTWVASPTLVGSPSTGDSCTFTLNVSKKTITITKIKTCTAPTATQYPMTNATKTYGSVTAPTITPASGAGTVETVYYTGVSPTSYSKSSTLPTNAGTYKVTVDVNAGTTYCAKDGIELTGNFVINKANQAELTLSSSASSACVAGGSITFLTTGGSGGGAVTYAITSGTGGSISGNTLTATQAGEFTVQATKAASTNYNAKTSNEVTVTFVAIPATPNATDISVCSGEDATFNATSASGASIDWYDVASGGTLLKENSNNYVVANLTVAKTVYAEAHNLTTGCVSATRKAVAATIKGATLTVSPSSVSTNPYAVNTLTATSTPAASVTWSTTTGYFVDENNKKSDAPVANSVKVKPGETGGNVTATVVSGGCTTNTIVPVTVSADTQDCQ